MTQSRDTAAQPSSRTPVGRALAFVAGTETTRPVRKLLLQVLFWTAIAGMTTINQIVTLTVNHREFDWLSVTLVNFGNWYLWALESIGIVRFAHRFPLDSGRWKSNLGWHGLAAVVAAVLMSIMGYPLDLWVNGARASFSHYLGVHFGFDFLLYWITAGVAYAFEYQRRLRERELRASLLEAALAQTQLHVLRMQLHPHFLFNALNSVSALLHRDPDGADRMIARLGELLRASMEGGAEQVLPLRQEVELLQRYLDIMQVRFRDRLRVRLDLDPETLDSPVPNMILQPLTENAIRHAISPRAEGGRITIASRFCDNLLEVVVEDDGPGLSIPKEEALRSGLGLSNTLARLESLYGPGTRLFLEPVRHASSGLCVRVLIPRGVPGS